MRSRMRHLFTEPLTVKPYMATTASGSPVYGDTYTVMGRVAIKAQRFITDDGETIKNVSKVYTDGTIEKGDVITYAGGEGVAAEVVPCKNLRGAVDHLEVVLS